MRVASKKFNLRCTDSDFEQLSLKANRANLPLSRYLIECGLSDNASFSPHLRENIDQIKFESALLQHHLDLLLNKKSHLEQLLASGDLHNFIFYLTSSAKFLHDIFLSDKNQINKIDQTNSSTHNQTNQLNTSTHNQIKINQCDSDNHSSTSNPSVHNPRDAQ